MCRELLIAGVVAAVLVGCSEDERLSPPQGAGSVADSANAQPDQTSEADSSESNSIAKRSVEGELRYYPQNVKSVEAWMGHEFMVGETPIRPTKTVTTEILKQWEGKTVRIEGVWNPGEKRKPAEEDQPLSSPIFPDESDVIVGSGIEAAKIEDVGEE